MISIQTDHFRQKIQNQKILGIHPIHEKQDLDSWSMIHGLMDSKQTSRVWSKLNDSSNILRVHISHSFSALNDKSKHGYKK